MVGYGNTVKIEHGKGNKIKLIETIEPEFLENNKCDNCKFKNSFVCNQSYKKLMWDGFFNIYNLVIDIYQYADPNRLHDFELESHRLGKYHVLTASNHHCGEFTKCECSIFRCDNYDIMQARKIPFCINLFNLKIPEKYLSGDYMFLIHDK
jgi:hypothetical protein